MMTLGSHSLVNPPPLVFSTRLVLTGRAMAPMRIAASALTHHAWSARQHRYMAISWLRAGVEDGARSAWLSNGSTSP